MTTMTSKMLEAMIAKAVATAVSAALTGNKSPAKVAVKLADKPAEKAAKASLAKFNSPDPDKTDRRIKWLNAVQKGFARKGVKLAWDAKKGRFLDTNSYKDWLAAGRQVKKGEHGVKGVFHVTQTEPMDKAAMVAGAQAAIRAHNDAKKAPNGATVVA